MFSPVLMTTTSGGAPLYRCPSCGITSDAPGQAAAFLVAPDKGLMAHAGSVIAFGGKGHSLPHKAKIEEFLIQRSPPKT